MKRFVPFSEGARDCVGQSLARLNLTTTLAQLFGSFSFRLADEVRGSDPGFDLKTDPGMCACVRCSRWSLCSFLLS